MHQNEIKDGRIELGYGYPIVLDKMFGPTIFAQLRVTAVIEREGWVIERAVRDGWMELCVIPAQTDQDFESSEGQK